MSSSSSSLLSSATSDEQWGKMIQSKSYWDSRYANDYKKGEKVFEWYLNFEALQVFFNSIVASKDDHVLEIGCGNSTLSDDLSKNGYTSVTSIDYSSVVRKK